MELQILRLNIAGQPIEWLNWQEAVTLYAREIVAWSLGDTIRKVYGGTCRATGLQTMIALPSILACDGGRLARARSTYPLNNRTLFSRDGHICMYCGGKFPDSVLTRDHIIPLSKGGRDVWENVVTSCRRCNQHKGNALLEDANMELLAMPYRPNLAEYLALVNSRRIRADQMEFLSSQFSKNYRTTNWH